MNFNQENEDEKTIKSLSKKLKMKGKKSIFDEGFGEILQICDHVLEKPSKIEHVRIEKRKKEEPNISKPLIKHKNIEKKKIEIKNSEIEVFDNCEIKKSLKTILNKISDKNMLNLINEFGILFEKYRIYRTSDELSNLTLEFICQSELMPDRYILIYSVFISLIHYIYGNEIMGRFLFVLIHKFEEKYDDLIDEPLCKICHNIISIICSIFYFDNISYCLIEDFINKLLIRFHEQDIQMILIILKYIGFYLRKNHPHILKQIVLSVHQKCKSIPKLSLRATFMLETITAIQHNNPSKVTDYDAELFESFKKLEKSILKDKNKEGNILNVQIDQILNKENAGQWLMSDHTNIITQQSIEKLKSCRDWDEQLILAAKNQRYNDKTKIDIFCTIMTSNNADDAFTRLNLLNLQSKNRDLIIRILIQVCLQESSFNPFYCQVIQLFTNYHRTFSSSLLFSMRDQLRILKEFDDFSIDNLTQLILNLLICASIKISLFKIINFSKLTKIETNFYQKLFKLIISNPSYGSLKKIFGILQDENLSVLRDDILCFLLYNFHQNQKLAQRIKIVSSISHGCDSSL